MRASIMLRARGASDATGIFAPLRCLLPDRSPNFAPGSCTLPSRSLMNLTTRTGTESQTQSRLNTGGTIGTQTMSGVLRPRTPTPALAHAPDASVPIRVRACGHMQGTLSTGLAVFPSLSRSPAFMLTSWSCDSDEFSMELKAELQRKLAADAAAKS